MAQGGKVFLCRFSVYFPKGSLKLHLILKDDSGAPHSHPWTFWSLLLIPYAEYVEGVMLDHVWLEVVHRRAEQFHSVRLYRIFGVRIPALTIGWYGQKVRLCSLCTELGYCRAAKRFSDVGLTA